jgi:hypothetical protein
MKTPTEMTTRSQTRAHWQSIADRLNPNTWALRGLVAAQVALAAQSHAQADFKMPTVDLPGVDADSDPVDMFVQAFKFLGQMIMWVFVVVAGFVVVKNIIKSINKVRRDEEGQWGAVVGEIIANVFVLVFLIVVATWVGGYIGTDTEA